MKYFLSLVLLCATITSVAQTFSNINNYDIQNGVFNAQATCQLADGPLEVPLTISGIGTLGSINSIESVELNITHRRVNEL